MVDVIFIGPPHEADAYRAAGFLCFQPSPRNLTERVLAERARCRVLAMTQATFSALPSWLSRDLREARWPLLAIMPDMEGPQDAVRVPNLLRRIGAETAPVAA